MSRPSRTGPPMLMIGLVLVVGACAEPKAPARKVRRDPEGRGVGLPRFRDDRRRVGSGRSSRGARLRRLLYLKGRQNGGAVAGAGRFAAARQFALARRVRRGAGSNEPLVHVVRYDFAQLKDWSELLLESFANRLRVAAVHRRAREPVMGGRTQRCGRCKDPGARS